jgi:hypothetical protein
MNLWELSNVASPASPGVPDWALGCFRRKSITYCEGSTDTVTEVIWLQTRGLTADFRLAPTRPHLVRRSDILDCDPHTLSLLLEVEAGVSRTEWDGTTMSWRDWVGFQPRVQWPEPGILRRVGDCLIEFAPSGAYVEDWRVEPAGRGPLVGLELLEERDARDGSLRHRGGALIVCGHHAAFVKGRLEALAGATDSVGPVQPEASLRANLDAWFACEASYGIGTAKEGHIAIVKSTSPWREGEALLAVDGFEYEGGELVLQRVVEDGRSLERRFRIDTLMPYFEPGLATPITEAGEVWLAREGARLLRHARSSGSTHG